MLGRLRKLAIDIAVAWLCVLENQRRAALRSPADGRK